MEQKNIYHSPVICYEISHSHGAYHIDVYIDGHKGSEKADLHCELRNFSNDVESARRFALMLSQNAALPIHIPELAEEFLSV